MPKIFSFLMAFFWTLIFLGFFGCRFQTADLVVHQSISISVVFDPTTQIEPLVRKSEMSSQLSAEEKQIVFLDEVKLIVVQKLAAKLQPSDVFFLSSVTANSRQTGEPFSFELPAARNNKEKNKFLGLREEVIRKSTDWFELFRKNPPCKNPKIKCSDIFSSILIAAKELQTTNIQRKVLLVFSDGQDNITEIKTFPPNALADIDVKIFYASPSNRKPADYEPFRLKLLQIFQTGNPRSVEILFPTEARAFNIEEFVTDIRRGAR